MSNTFPLDVMSSLSKKMRDIQSSLLSKFPELKVVGVDDSVDLENVLTDDAPALLWQFNTLEPRPRDPLYGGEIQVGAKTTEDSGGYELTELLNAVVSAFSVGEVIPVSDFSGVVEAPGKGVITVSQAMMNPQLFDNNSGIRMYRVTFSGQRFT